MEVISHRGYHAVAPENTLEAFSLAVDMGVDGIETDLRLSADGKVVLFHDRIAPGGQDVAAISHQELSRQVGYRVTTLPEALEAFADITWMLEIKAPEALEPAVPIIRDYSGRRRFQITSFVHPVVARAKTLVDAQFGLLVAHRPLEILAEPLGWDPRRTGIDSIVWKYDVLDRDIVDQARSLGLKSYVYAVETPEDHLHCTRDLALDGIISDTPELLLPPNARGN